MISTIGVPLAVAFALSLVAVPLCRLAALRLGFVARPREDRWHRGVGRRTGFLDGGQRSPPQMAPRLEAAVPFEEEDDSPFVGLLQVEAA